MSSPNITDLEDSTYKAFLAETAGPVLLDFWAPWCGPCRMLMPTLEELASENAGRFAIAKINIENCPDAAGSFGIRSVPSLVFAKDGERREMAVGVLSKAEILQKLESLG